MKNIIVAILCFLSISLVCGQGPGGAPPKAVVAVGKVIETEDMESRRYTGLVVSKSVVQIVSRVSGEILEVGFKDGSVVKKGQMLYRLDPIQYEAAVKSAEAKISEYKAKVVYAQNNFDRNNSLFEKKAVSLDAMENTKAALDAYKAALLAAEADLITAKDNLKNTMITAPMEGIAGVTNYTAGNYITPSSGVLVTIIQAQPIRVRFSISTADLLSMFDDPDSLKKNAVVRVKLSNGTLYPEAGRIELLNNEANRKTDAIQVFATFSNSDFKLITGSTVSVTLSRKKGKMVPAVPPSALMYDNQGSYVYVVDKANKVEKRYVVPGNTTPELQMIETGLKAGETVVIKGTHKTMPGGEIEPVASEK